MNSPYLTFKIDGSEDIDAPIDAEVVTLGRADDNTIVIPNTWISSHHARFIRNPDGSVRVIDLDSHNGIAVNGKPEKQRTLTNGDNLKFGLIEAVFVNRKVNPRPAAVTSPAAKPRPTRSPELHGAESEIDSLKATASSLIDEIASLETQSADLQAAEQKFAELTGALDKLDQRKTHVESTIHDTSADLQTLRDQIVLLAAEEQKAAAAAGSTKAELSKLSSNREALKTENDELGRKVEALKQSNRSLEDKAKLAKQSKSALDTLASENEAALKTAGLLKQQIESLTADRDTLKTQGEDAARTVDKLKADAELLTKQQSAGEKSQAEAGKLALESKRAAESATALAREIEELTRNREALKQEAGELAKTVEGLKKENQLADRSKTELQRIATETEEKAAKAESFRQEIETLTSTRDSLLSETGQLDQKLGALKASETALAEQQQQSAASAKASLAEIAAEKNTAAETATTLKSEISSLTSNRTTLKKEVEALSAEVASLQEAQKSIAQQRQQLDETKAELTHLIERRVDAEEKLVVLDKRRNNLETELAGLKTEIEETQANAAKKTAAVTSDDSQRMSPDLGLMTAQRDALAAEIASHTKKLAEAKIKLSETWEQFTALSDERDAIRQKHQESASELEQLQAQAEQLRDTITQSQIGQSTTNLSAERKANGFPSNKKSRRNGSQRPHNQSEPSELTSISDKVLGVKRG